MKTREMVLGVDFGTSYSSAGVLIDDRVDWVVDSGEPTIPSVVHIPISGPPLVGRQAQQRMAIDPANTVRSIKRILGRSLDDKEVKRLDAGVGYRIVDGPRGQAILKIRRTEYAAEQIAALILSRLRTLAERRFGCKIRSAVVAVPAAATPDYVAALRRSCGLAHMDLIQVVPEPIAGALAMGLHAQDMRRRIAVCDFGGGTFDATLMWQAGRVFQPVACVGDSLLGGDDFDDAFASAIADRVYRASKFDMRNDAVRWQLLRLRCESVKRTLSFRNEAPLTMPDAYVQNSQRRDIDLLVDRAWLEPCWKKLMQRARDVLQKLCAAAGWSPKEIDDVVMIGGTTLIPMVRRELLDFFDTNEAICSDAAQIAVAHGATLQTAAHAQTSTTAPVLASHETQHLD